MKVPQKAKNRTIYALAILLLDEFLTAKKTKTTNLKRCRHPNVHNNISYNSQDMEATQGLSTNEQIKKMWYTLYMHRIE